MKRNMTILVAAGLLAAAPLAAQRAKATLTLSGPGAGAARVDVITTDSVRNLGLTDVNGALSFDTSLLAGKPRISVRVEQCPTSAPNIALFPVTPQGTDAQYDQCDQGCKCKRRAGAFIWGEDYHLTLGPSFFSGPKGYAILGAGAGAVALGIAANGGSSSTPSVPTQTTPSTPTTPSNPTPTPTTPAFSSILGTYNLTGSVQSRGGCGFNNFLSTFTLGGTESATTGQLVEQITRNMTGSSMLQNTTWNFSLSGSGTVPGLGNYTETFNGQVNGTALTGTETLNLPCGAVVVAQSGSHR